MGKLDAGCLCLHFVNSAWVSSSGSESSAKEKLSRVRVIDDGPIGHCREERRLYPNSWSLLDWTHLPHSWEGWNKEAIGNARYQLNRQRVEGLLSSTKSPPRPNFVEGNPRAGHIRTQRNAWRPTDRAMSTTKRPGPSLLGTLPPSIGLEPRCGSIVCNKGSLPRWPVGSIRPFLSGGLSRTCLRAALGSRSHLRTTRRGWPRFGRPLRSIPVGRPW